MQLQIPLLFKAMPKMIETIDCSPLSLVPVMDETILLEAIIQEFREMIQFDMIYSPRFPLILGIS